MKLKNIVNTSYKLQRYIYIYNLAFVKPKKVCFSKKKKKTPHIWRRGVIWFVFANHNPLEKRTYNKIRVIFGCNTLHVFSYFPLNHNDKKEKKKSWQFVIEYFIVAQRQMQSKKQSNIFSIIKFIISK